MGIEEYTPGPMSQEEKRAAKFRQLQAERQAVLDRYFQRCDDAGERPDFTYLMENFGADLEFVDDEYLDSLIARDQERIRAGEPVEAQQLYKLRSDAEGE